MDMAIASDSSSHGNHLIWNFFTLAEKKPATLIRPIHFTQSVEPIPNIFEAASVTNHSSSDALGRVIGRLSDSEPLDRVECLATRVSPYQLVMRNHGPDVI